jgi:hypothetical protein
MNRARGVMQKRSEYLTDILHIFVLFSFALAQPLFDLLSRNVEFFIARKSEPVDIVVLVIILCMVVPAVVVLVEVVVGLFSWRIRKVLHSVIVTVLVAATVLPGLKKAVGEPGAVLLVVAAVTGLVVAVVYSRFRPARMVLTVLSPAIIVFPGLFLINSPVFKVVFPDEDPAAVKVEVKDPVPVVMVILDELPVTSLMDENRQIDPVRYPNFAALARDSYWFRNAAEANSCGSSPKSLYIIGREP